MSKFDGICPICGRPILTNELFVLQWHAPRKWWVARHLVPDPDGTSLEPYMVLTTRYRSYCGRANYNPETGRFNT